MDVHTMLRHLRRHKPKDFEFYSRDYELDLTGVRLGRTVNAPTDTYLHSFPSCCGIAVLHALPGDFETKARLERFKTIVAMTKKAAKAEGTSLVLAVTSENDQGVAGEILRNAGFKRIVSQLNPKSTGVFILWMCNLMPKNEIDDDEGDDE